MIIDTQKSCGIIVLARDPPTRHFGRVFGRLDGFWRGGQLSKTLKNSPNGRVVFQTPKKLAQMFPISLKIDGCCTYIELQLSQ